MSWALIGSAAVSVVGGVLSSSASAKAAKAAAAAGQTTPVDINALNTQTQNQSVQNAALGNQLEQQYNPYINSLRQQSAQALQQYTQPSNEQNALYGSLLNQYGQAAQGPAAGSTLFNNAATEAQKQLSLGGTLDQSTQNQIMRAGAAKSGGLAGPGGGLGMGRDIAARDLGLSSLNLQNSRMQNAANIGSTQQNYGLSAQQQQLSNMLGLGGLANQMSNDQFTRNFNLAQMTQNIQQPQVGLSPSSVAGIVTGNSNMANNANQNSAAIAAQNAAGQGAMGGQLIGVGLNGLINSFGNKNTGNGTVQATPAANQYGGYGNENYGPGY